jgi:hypothetical protein
VPFEKDGRCVCRRFSEGWNDAATCPQATPSNADDHFDEPDWTPVEKSSTQPQRHASQVTPPTPPPPPLGLGSVIRTLKPTARLERKMFELLDLDIPDNLYPTRYPTSIAKLTGTANTSLKLVVTY